MLGLTFAGHTTLLDLQGGVEKKHVDFGGAVTLLGSGVVGVETIFVLTPGFFQTKQSPLSDTPPPELESSRTMAWMANGVLTVPRRWTEYFLRPFVSGGIGMLRASQTQKINVLSYHAAMAGFNIGGGAIGFLSKGTGVRFDLRYYGTLHGTDQGPIVQVGDGLARLHYMTASIGLVIRR